MANYVNIVERALAALPQTGDLGLFTVVGRVEVVRIVGEVDTTAIGAVPNATLLKVNPTVGATVDLCASFDVNAATVGTMFNITGTAANAMVATVSGAMPDQVTPVVVEDGVIELECAANSGTGTIKWTLHYVPLDASSYVVEVAVP